MDYYLSLAGSVGEDQENDPADIKSTAASLTNLGIGHLDRAAQTGVWNGDFDGGVRHYQASNGLDVDGVLLPGGPTQRSINNALGFSTGVRARADDAEHESDFASARSPRPAASDIPRREDNGGHVNLDTASPIGRDDDLIARGYRYRPDPMGRIDEGDWLDGFGRLSDVAELRRKDAEADRSLPASRPAASENVARPSVGSSRAVGTTGPSTTEFPHGETFVSDGGKAFARELLRATKLEDFDEPSVYFDALDIPPDEVEGAEQIGFREDLRKILEAMRRRGGATPKPQPGPPQPPPGAPPLPRAVSERLDHIKDPQVRTAANRLLDGAVVKGWVPRGAVSAEPAQVVKQGGRAEAFKDFGQFIGRTGGTKSDIKSYPDGSHAYVAPDRTRITLYDAKRGQPTNLLLIETPGLAGSRAGRIYVKIRYD